MQHQTSAGRTEQAVVGSGSAAEAHQIDSSAFPSNSPSDNNHAPRTSLNGEGSHPQCVPQAQGSHPAQTTSTGRLTPITTPHQTQPFPSHDALQPTSGTAHLDVLAVGYSVLPSSTSFNASFDAAPRSRTTSNPDQAEGERQPQASATVESDVSDNGASIDALADLLGPVPSGPALAPSGGSVMGRGKAKRPRAPKGKDRAMGLGKEDDGQQAVIAPKASETGATLTASGKGRSQGMTESEMDEQTRIQLLFSLDQRADEALAANSRYAQEVVAVMNKLEAAKNRSEELQSLVKDLHTELADGTDTVIIAPGTIQVTLPWHKHFHGQDLLSNPDSAARELYLDTIRYTPWTPLERGKLKKEVIAQNNREVAIEAHRLGESISNRLAQTDPAFFEQSTEFLDWGKISQAASESASTALFDSLRNLLLTFILAVNAQIPRRSASDCRIQWLQQDHPHLKHGKWKKEELERLYEIAERNGERDWQSISEELGIDGEGKGRTPAECLRQFRRRTGVKKEWTTEEDEGLRQGVKHYGEEWQAIALSVGRPSDQCINRWNKAVKPTIRRGQWQPDEDEAVRAAVAAVGLDWIQIARRVEGRTDAQCRERWVNKLDPKIRATEKWSTEEDEFLRHMRDEQKKSWVEISNGFDGRRTDNQCMRRYNTLTGSNRRVPRANNKSSAPKPSSRKRKRNASPPPSPAGSSSPAPEARPMPSDIVLDDHDEADEFVPPRSARLTRRKPAPRAKRAQAEGADPAPAPRPRGRPRKLKTDAQVEQVEEEAGLDVEEEAENQLMEVERAQVQEDEEGAPRRSGRQRKGTSLGGNSAAD